MTTFLFVRHGQSIGNLKKSFMGHMDLDLSEKGYLQAEKTAEYIYGNYRPDVIYSSDLLRAYNTAKVAARLFCKEVIKSEKLREICGGDWEGKTFNELQGKYPEEYGTWLKDIGNSKCTNGESPKMLIERVLPEVIEIAEKNDGKTVLLATHAMVIRCLQTVWEQKSLSEMKDIPWVGNASVSVVCYNDGKWEEKIIGNDSFLGDFASSFPRNV